MPLRSRRKRYRSFSSAHGVRGKIEAFRNLIQRKAPREKLKELGNELYDLLLKPAEKQIDASWRMVPCISFPSLL